MKKSEIKFQNKTLFLIEMSAKKENNKLFIVMKIVNLDQN